MSVLRVVSVVRLTRVSCSRSPFCVRDIECVMSLHRIWCECGARHHLVLCPFCVWGAAESHGGRKQSPPSPKGVTPAAARTIHFSSSRCARAEKVASASAPPYSHSLGSRRPGVSLLSRALTEGMNPPEGINPPPVESPTGDSTPTGVTGDVLNEGINRLAF